MASKSKDTVEKLKKGAKDFGGKVAKGSKKLYDLAELNVKKAKLKQDNEKAFQKLGELTYKKGKLTGKAADLGDQIKANKAEIKKLDAKLQKAKAKKK